VGKAHVGSVTEYPANVPAYRFKFYCEGCQYQSYQETRESAEAVMAAHQKQYSYVQTTSVVSPVVSVVTPVATVPVSSPSTVSEKVK
jgi:hypothetical protein